MTIIAVHLEHVWQATRHLTLQEKETVMGALKEASIRGQLFEQASMLRDYQQALRDLRRKVATKANRTRKRAKQWQPDDTIALTAKGRAYLERQRAKKGAQP